MIPLILVALSGFSQDHMYSQFFNSPLYLNPALTGQFEGDFRANLIYRNQFTSVPGSFNYLTASADLNIPQFGGGVGLMITHSSEGTAYLSTNNISGLYSYSVRINDAILSFGLQAGVSNQSIDWSRLIFDDQIDSQYGYIPGSVSAAEPPEFNNKYYFDSGAGINLVAGEFDFGSALQHLNRPNDSFTGTPSQLAMRYTGHLSYRWVLDPDANVYEDEKSYIIPSVVFYKQSAAQSYNIGFQYKHGRVNVGLWYRSGGTDGGPSACVVSLIFDLFVNHDTGENMRMGLSHDVPVSSLNYSNTSGTTEIAVGYITPFPTTTEPVHKFEGLTHCYDFY